MRRERVKNCVFFDYNKLVQMCVGIVLNFFTWMCFDS